MLKPLHKVAVLDIETTGVDPRENGIVQLAGAILIGGEIEETFDFKCAPFASDKIDDEALEAQGVTWQEIQQREHPVTVYRKLLSILGGYVDKYNKTDKLGFVAFNAQFDNSHMRAWFNKCDEQGGQYFGSWFWTPAMDLMAASALLFGERRVVMPDFKQASVCHVLGIQPDGELHDAGVDVRMAIKLYQRLTGVWFARPSEADYEFAAQSIPK